MGGVAHREGVVDEGRRGDIEEEEEVVVIVVVVERLEDDKELERKEEEVCGDEEEEGRGRLGVNKEGEKRGRGKADISGSEIEGEKIFKGKPIAD
jgi:hypothetical protein